MTMGFCALLIKCRFLDLPVDLVPQTFQCVFDKQAQEGVNSPVAMSYHFIPEGGDEKGARPSPGLPDGQDHLDMILLQAKAHHRCQRKFRSLGVTC